LFDQAQTRIATFLTLRDRLDPTSPAIDASRNTSDPSSTNLDHRNTIHIVNTHYDDQGKKSRAWASWLVRVMADDWVTSSAERDGGEQGASDEDLVIWMGDFSRFSGSRGDRCELIRRIFYCASQTLPPTIRRRKDTPTLFHPIQSHTPHPEVSSS
jgi:hypothetical protein